jgi:hypothetical protein
MRKLDNEHDDARGENPSLEEELWGAEGGGESLVDDSEPGFDNREARDTLSESLDDPTDATPRDLLEEEPAPKKKSNMPFYGAVGAFAVVVVGLLGYKSGLIGGASRKPIEPQTVASAMAGEASKKPESLMGAAGASNAASPDLLGGGEAKARPALEAEADLLSEKSPSPASSPAAPAVSVAQAQSLETSPPVPAPTQSEAAPPAQAPVAAAAVVVEKAAPAATPAEVTKTEMPVAAPVAAAAPNNGTRSDSRESAAAPVKSVSSKRERRRLVTANKAAPREKLAHAPRASKPVRVAEVRKVSSNLKRGGKVDRDATPESKEVLAGWKLRGTWPSHGQSQLAWIADESGRLTTVSVGAVVSGAKVLSIGKRGEVVQTTAGQILP